MVGTTRVFPADMGKGSGILRCEACEMISHEADGLLER